jgi:hypothetical protein
MKPLLRTRHFSTLVTPGTAQTALRISVTISGAACASKTSPIDARSIPRPLKMITAHEKSAAQSSACAQEGPPINAAEITDSCCQRRHRVGAMVPCISLKGLAFNGHAAQIDPSEEPLLENDGRPKNDQRETCRSMIQVGRALKKKDFAYAGAGQALPPPQ